LQKLAVAKECQAMGDFDQTDINMRVLRVIQSLQDNKARITKSRFTRFKKIRSDTPHEVTPLFQSRINRVNHRGEEGMIDVTKYGHYLKIRLLNQTLIFIPLFLLPSALPLASTVDNFSLRHNDQIMALSLESHRVRQTTGQQACVISRTEGRLQIPIITERRVSSF
jgi:hypothetical protein